MELAHIYGNSWFGMKSPAHLVGIVGKTLLDPTDGHHVLLCCSHRLDLAATVPLLPLVTNPA